MKFVCQESRLRPHGSRRAGLDQFSTMTVSDVLRALLLHCHHDSPKSRWLRVCDHTDDSPNNTRFADPVAKLDSEKRSAPKKEWTRLQLLDKLSLRWLMDSSNIGSNRVTRAGTQPSGNFDAWLAPKRRLTAKPESGTHRTTEIQKQVTLVRNKEERGTCQQKRAATPPPAQSQSCLCAWHKCVNAEHRGTRMGDGF